MTTVTFSNRHNHIRVTAYDHAYGSDAVCNGISALLYSLESWLLNHPKEVKAHESDFVSGKAEIEFIPASINVLKILGFVYQGLRQIEHTYGKNFISVNVSEELEELMG